MNELAVQIPWRAMSSLGELIVASCVELVHMMFDLLDRCIFLIITRCLSTKYSLLFFGAIFFHSSRLLAVVDQWIPSIVLNSPAHLVAGLPRRRCPMRGSHIVASCAHLQLLYVVAPSVLSISELSLAGLRQFCLPRLLFWHLGSCHEGICLRFSAPFSFGKPGSSSSGFCQFSDLAAVK